MTGTEVQAGARVGESEGPGAFALASILARAHCNRILKCDRFSQITGSTQAVTYLSTSFVLPIFYPPSSRSEFSSLYCDSVRSLEVQRS